QRRARINAEQPVGVNLDVAGPGVVAGDIEQGPGVVDAGAVEQERFVNGAGDVVDLKLRVLADRDGRGGVAQGVGVGDDDDAGVMVNGDRADQAAVVVGQRQCAGAFLGQLDAGGAAEVAGDCQAAGLVHGEEPVVAGVAGQHHVQRDGGIGRAGADGQGTAARGGRVAQPQRVVVGAGDGVVAAGDGDGFEGRGRAADRA